MRARVPCYLWSKASEKKQISGTSLLSFVAIESKMPHSLTGPLVEIPRAKTCLETSTFNDQSRRK